MKHQAFATALLLCSASWAAAQQATDAIAPEAASQPAAGADAFGPLTDAARAALDAKAEGRPVAGQDWMVSAAHPLAVQAGARVLEAGGSAADAMVAVQTVLGLVEPQSSGLGGGTFLVWYDAGTGELTTLDGRETAPMAATPRLFLDEEGQPLEFMEAVVGGLSVGTPGTPALLEAAHRRWGRANWSGLFDDAIRLAEYGFTVSPRLASLVAGEVDALQADAATTDYFFPGGQPVAAGATLRNPDYAETLRLLAAEGADGFYGGKVAEGIVAAVRGADAPAATSRMPRRSSSARAEETYSMSRYDSPPPATSTRTFASPSSRASSGRSIETDSMRARGAYSRERLIMPLWTETPSSSTA